MGNPSGRNHPSPRRPLHSEELGRRRFGADDRRCQRIQSDCRLDFAERGAPIAVVYRGGERRQRRACVDAGGFAEPRASKAGEVSPSVHRTRPDRSRTTTRTTLGIVS